MGEHNGPSSSPKKKRYGLRFSIYTNWYHFAAITYPVWFSAMTDPLGFQSQFDYHAVHSCKIGLGNHTVMLPWFITGELVAKLLTFVPIFALQAVYLPLDRCHPFPLAHVRTAKPNEYKTRYHWIKNVYWLLSLPISDHDCRYFIDCLGHVLIGPSSLVHFKPF